MGSIVKNRRYSEADAGDESSADYSQAVFIEQVKALYKALPPILAINLIVGSMMMYGLWHVVPQINLRIWAGAMVVVIIARLTLYLFYRRRFSMDKLQRYAMLFVVGSGVTGCVWGVAGVVLFPVDELEYQLFILFVLVGMGAGAVTSLTAYLPAFYFYLLPSMLPISVGMFYVTEPIHTALAVMTLAYVVALSFFAHNIHRSFVQSLTLRFENIHLVKELSIKKEQAEQANISKSKFLAAASHDLRQPLHALTLFTSVLDESIQYPKVRKVVDQINASVQALQNLFNALLDISRLEAGVMVASKEHFKLQPLLMKLANEYNPQAHEKQLTLNWPHCTYTVYSDPLLLEQILRNYLSNAIRYTERGSVSVFCIVENLDLCIEVRDTGAGIPAHAQQSVYKEFHQLSNPERDRSKGLGLGLAIVERIARLLEHDISLKSEPDKGSTFSVTVPLGDQALVKSSGDDELTSTLGDVRDVTVVVIDDEVSVREGMEHLLQKWHSDVISASDADEAINALQQHSKTPDGIIADYRLRKGATGIDAIQQIRAVFNSEIPALVVTGDIAEDTLRLVKESGFQLLHKPVAPIKLRAFLQNIHTRKQRN